MHPSIASLTFGAEYEVISPLSRAASGAKITELSGIPVHTDMNSPAPRGSWKIISDLSIELRGNRGTAIEVVSPILSGQAGLDQVVKVVNALRDMGCVVNTSTGHHVHVGRPTDRIDFLKDLLKLYGHFEVAIDQLMPASRRANGAFYCRSVANINRTAIDGARSLAELQQVQTRASGAGNAKYHKVNLAPVGKPTVEFRQHSGTVDATKSVNWITTCLTLVARAFEGKIGEGTAQTVAWDLARLVGKQAHCAALISRPEGATNNEIRLAFGYRTISARTNLKRAGLPFREERDRATGKTRFFAVAAPAPQAGETVGYPATVEGFADFIEADEAKRQYFAERARATRR